MYRWTQNVEIMPYWTAFPCLVREMIIGNMSLKERCSLTKCSKKAMEIVTRIPIHLAKFKSTLETEGFLVTEQDSEVFKMPVETLSAFMTHRKSSIFYFDIKISNSSPAIIRRLGEMRVQGLRIEVAPSNSDMLPIILKRCEPKFLKGLEIQKACTQEVYEEMTKTEQWRNCERISMHEIDNGKLNIDDFLHLSTIQLNMKSLTIEEAKKIVKLFDTRTEPKGFFVINLGRPFSGAEELFNSMETPWFFPPGRTSSKCKPLDANYNKFAFIDYSEPTFHGGFMERHHLEQVYGVGFWRWAENN